MLTHRNVGSNVAAVDQIIRLARRRRAAGHPADLPLLRLHHHAVDRADAAAEGHLPLQPAGSPRGRQALPQARRDDHDHHAHVRALVPAAVRAGGFRQAGRGRSPGPRSSRPRWPTPSSSGSACGRSKATAPRSFRRWSRPTFRPAAASGRHGSVKEGTVGRPLPGIAVEGRRSRHGRGPRAEPVGHVAGQGPERDEGLLRPARPDGRGDPRRLVHDRRRGRDRRRGLHHASPAASAASRRSAARWCRTSAWKRPSPRCCGSTRTSPKWRSPPCPTRRRASGWWCSTPSWRKRRRRSAAAWPPGPAAALDSLARQFSPRGGDPAARHRQAGPCRVKDVALAEFGRPAG